MNNDKCWWSRYGNFDPGIGVYPHMGQVVAHYRLKRRFKTQQDLAIALGISKRTVEELEGTVNMNAPDSIERRQVIARLLKIPPALLALDWRFMVSDDVDQEHSFADVTKLLEDDTFTLYQNILHMGRGYLYNGGPSYIAGIVDESLNKLLPITRNLSEIERESWLEMLCRYYQLSTSFALRRLDKKQTLLYAKRSIEIAQELDNVQLIASTYYRRIRVHLDLRKAAISEDEKQRRLERAKMDVQAVLQYKDVASILKGNIYLIAAEVYSLDASDSSTRRQCERWQDQAATIVYKTADNEEDDTFLRLNGTALHHEKAKTLIQFKHFKEAQNELNIARKALQADLLTWHINLYITEAQLYKAQNDLEGSAISGVEAYKIAKVVQSLKDEAEVKRLFLELKHLDAANPHVCNLGRVVGMY
jgi:transcriptional regulator with XRE-family HTH domain